MLTTFVFYIPFKGHKITFAISILVTLTIFFLVLIDLIPPTSLVIPLIAKYLLFTIILVAVSIFVSVITLNIYHRSGTTHTMPHWVRWLFLKKLPSKLCIKPPESDESEDELGMLMTGNYFVRRVFQRPQHCFLDAVAVDRIPDLMLLPPRTLSVE